MQSMNGKCYSLTWRGELFEYEILTETDEEFKVKTKYSYSVLPKLDKYTCCKGGVYYDQYSVVSKNIDKIKDQFDLNTLRFMEVYKEDIAALITTPDDTNKLKAVQNRLNVIAATRIKLQNMTTEHVAGDMEPIASEEPTDKIHISKVGDTTIQRCRKYVKKMSKVIDSVSCIASLPAWKEVFESGDLEKIDNLVHGVFRVGKTVKPKYNAKQFNKLFDPK